MTVRVHMALNALEPDTWTEHEVDDLVEFLMGELPTWPETARLYHGQVDQSHDVTPATEAATLALRTMEGPFYVVVYPQDPFTIIAIVAVAAVAAAAFLLQPQAAVAAAAARNQQATSPNNDLSDRTNSARPGGRIPDIFGTVRSTPDLIMLPYKVFDDNQEVEIAYMCIGRGSYDVTEVQDGTTLISQIPGSSVQIYGPGKSPLADDPDVQIGAGIFDPAGDINPVREVQRCNSVNGQTLDPPSGSSSYTPASGTAHFVYPDTINFAAVTPNYGVNPLTGEAASDDYSTDITQYFQVGDAVTVTTSTISSSTVINLSGTYIVASVSATQLKFTTPSDVNGDWAHLADYPSNTATAGTLTVAGNGDAWIGPFTLNDPKLKYVMCNFVAINGMYKDDGTNQTKTHVDIRLEITRLDSDGSAIGSPTNHDVTINGSAKDKETKAKTLEVTMSTAGPVSVRCRRLTSKDTNFKGQVVDEVKWRDCYSAAPVTVSDFGDVTTVLSSTYATDGALAVKERKLNMLVTRKLPRRIGSTSTFTSTLYATTSADDIIAQMCRDTKIGNRQSSEVDFDSIYDGVADIKSYFGFDEAADFCYTFDKANVSFEETLQMVGSAIFSTVYRRGNVIGLKFEKATADSTLLFNHRNKVPGSETRTVTFGVQNDYDGVAFDYVDPTPGNNDQTITLYVPQGDASAINPNKIQSVGVRNAKQAHCLAWRAWRKLKYQNVAVEFTATQEANLLVLTDRILVADNTRPETQDGEVRSQSSLTLELSQPFHHVGGTTYTIFLQHTDGTVEGIGITPGTDANHVVLASAPVHPLYLDDGAACMPGYVIVGSHDVGVSAFLVTEKTFDTTFTHNVKAVNYDARYYANDDDYLS